MVVKSNNDCIIGQVPDGLAKVFHALIEDRKLKRMDKITPGGSQQLGKEWKFKSIIVRKCISSSSSRPVSEK